ncbi:MAG: T9SS type A sorting domain-containing protein [Fibrobacteraceae bacterium]|nr:T9SS type A sorting domain-containing protein [Fibrobacteraceae bacterium]
MKIQKLFLPALLISSMAFAEELGKYEAETATLSTDATVSGSYVKMNEGNITFENVNVASAGAYTLSIHYQNNYGTTKQNDIQINGTKAGTLEFSETASFTDISMMVNLKAGSNTIALIKNWGWIDVDYITISTYEPKAFDVCNAPTTPEATEAAKKLYNFLSNNFGTKTISGAMTGSMDNASSSVKAHEDVAIVYTQSGKYPALVGFDLLNATGLSAGESWFKEYTTTVMNLAKDTWKQGGIPAFTWHWNDPSDSVMAFYVKGANENYTTFDFTDAFVSGTTSWDTLSATYKAIVSDIDEVAALFLDLQNEGIAAIFRPIHESGGAWFWWSTHTGAQFAALYRLIYERMVFDNGVKNLIWVFNPQDAAKTGWNPGETHYDILSIDIYNNADDHSSNYAAFNGLKDNFGVTKILALSENGPIPDVTKMQDEGAVWSWWMPWYESWNGGYITKQTAKSVWQSNMASEYIITLDEMPGWDNYSEKNTFSKTCPTATRVSTFGADSLKNSETYENYLMQVTYNTLGDNGANIEFTKVPDLTGAKTISVEITNNGSGGADGGLWVGLAFVRDGSTDDKWTWEMSNTTSCWLNDGASATCEFDITEYTDENGNTFPTDLDNIFSVTLMASAVGFSGNVTFDNMVTDNGITISRFDSNKELFATSEQSAADVKTIQLVKENGESAKISTIKPNWNSALTYSNSSLQFQTNQAGYYKVELIGTNGARMNTLHSGSLSAGTHSFDISNIQRGFYIVRVKGKNFQATKPIIVK